MKIETLKKLIELESERQIDINTFKDSVIQLIDLYESDREVPSYPIGVPNTEPITPYPPSYPFAPTYVYPNGTPPTNFCGTGSASSPTINPTITTSNATFTGEVANTSVKTEFLHQCLYVCNASCFCPIGVCENKEMIKAKFSENETKK